MYSQVQRNKIAFGLAQIRGAREESEDYDDDERGSDAAIEILEPIVRRAASAMVEDKLPKGE